MGGSRSRPGSPPPSMRASAGIWTRRGTGGELAGSPSPAGADAAAEASEWGSTDARSGPEPSSFRNGSRPSRSSLSGSRRSSLTGTGASEPSGSWSPSPRRNRSKMSSVRADSDSGSDTDPWCLGERCRVKDRSKVPRGTSCRIWRGPRPSGTAPPPTFHVEHPPLPNTFHVKRQKSGRFIGMPARRG